MTDVLAMLADTTTRLFAAPSGDFAADWDAVEAAGLVDLLLPETVAGGFGGGWADAAVVLRASGAAAAALPLGEVMLARRRAYDAGVAVDALPVIAPAVQGQCDRRGRFSGVLAHVPWGRHATDVLVATGDALLCLAVADAQIVAGAAASGEPRDTLTFAAAPVQTAPARDLFADGALLRVLQSAGALAAARDLAVDYVNQRQQFGRALANFQAVQQLLAQVASEVAAVEAAATGAAAAADRGDAGFEIAAAKLRTNIAIGLCTAAVHQVHGAIGFTADYPLHPLTRRLWGWRSEFGNDAHWATWLGQHIALRGADRFWHDLAERGDRIGGAG